MNFVRPTLLTITAPTCSGKNFLMEALEQELGFTRIVSTTTRQIRAGEIDGKDYHFISDQESARLDSSGKFAELIEFRGTRYGVTHDEMNAKMYGNTVPMVILEPQGLSVYKKICAQNNWGVYSVYVSTVESTRIARLNNRTLDEICTAHDDLSDNESGADLRAKWNQSIKVHTDRLLSITGDERRWSNTNIWDAVVPGDDVRTAVEYIKLGVQNRNRRDSGPALYEAKV